MNEPETTRSQRKPRGLRVVGFTLAALLIIFSCFADILFGGRGTWAVYTFATLGLVWGGLTLAQWWRFQLRCYLALSATLGTLLVAELFFRVIGFDFAANRRTEYEQTPVYFRKPAVPLEPVFFRRAGSQEWRGQVIAQDMKRRGLDSSAYADEQPVHAIYDEEGFRNVPKLNEWTIAISGDSFVELGYLPQESLYTSIVSRKLNVPVKNLGVAGTGTYTQVAYLKAMGECASVRHWVIVYFEGNDLRNTANELARLEKYRAGQGRDHRKISDTLERQPSLLKAIMAMVKRRRSLDRQLPSATQIARTRFGDKELPTTISYTPPNESELKPHERRALLDSIASFAAAAQQRNIQPWLVYMPCKFRALYPHLRLVEDAPQRYHDWKPSDLNQYVERLCNENGIRFIDATPQLSAPGKITYNLIWDSHLSAIGSQATAEAIPAGMKDAIEP